MTKPADDQTALRVAFSAPLDRARVDASAAPADRIALRDHLREVEIGAFQAERGVTQRIRFDIVAEVALDPDAVAGDDVDGILSYDTLIEAIDAELAAERVNLLETLAERIAARVLLHDRAARVFVRIEKLDRGPHVLGVEIVRSRARAPAVAAPKDAPPRPRVVVLGPGQLAAPDLPAMLDRLTGGPAPAILLAAPDFPPPEAPQALAQRRIALLALEQAAWQLAARDRRCVVVDSRTELDWALRHGHLSVWAPSRMVLDATDGPAGADPLRLAGWLAARFDALDLTVVGLPGTAAEGPRQPMSPRWRRSDAPHLAPPPARPRGPADAPRLAGGWLRFTRVECLSRGAAPRVIPAADLPPEALARLTAPRPAVAGLAMDRPQIMGIVNVTPDSFSDGGRFLDPEDAADRAARMAGAAILDIGGESTRPGATEVAVDEEIARIAPVIEDAARAGRVISVDTRKAAVARAAVAAGAHLVNDVSAGTFDAAMLATVADLGVPVCLMHAQGAPETMQNDPRYDDVLFDVLDTLDARLAAARAAGIPPGHLIADPGIGFGKTRDHNLALLARIGVFHDLGVPILLGASRKRFIGDIAGVPVAEDRLPGTLAVTLAAVAQGVQIHRVHDVAEVAQGLTLWRAVTGKG